MQQLRPLCYLQSPCKCWNLCIRIPHLNIYFSKLPDPTPFHPFKKKCWILQAEFVCYHFFSESQDSKTTFKQNMTCTFLPIRANLKYTLCHEGPCSMKILAAKYLKQASTSLNKFGLVLNFKISFTELSMKMISELVLQSLTF